MDSTQLATASSAVVTSIIRNEIIREAAPTEGVVVTSDQVNAEIERVGLDNNIVTRDLAESALATQGLTDVFTAALPAEKEQVRFEIMLVESRTAASAVEAAVSAGSSLTDLSAQYSVATDIPVVQDWVPYELLANKDVAADCETLQPGQTASVLDPTAVKNLGYWLIEVIDKDDTGAIKCKVILASSLEDAQRAKERLATEDWDTVAKQYSQIYSQTPDGEFDWLTPDDVVTATFNEAAFSMPLNVISDPIVEREIQTNGAYWVIHLLERETRSLSDSVASSLASVAFDSWYTQVSQTADVENLLTPQQQSLAIDKVYQLDRERRCVR